jgi:hypothetical protein
MPNRPASHTVIWLALKAGAAGRAVAPADEVALDEVPEGAQPVGKNTTTSANATKKYRRRAPQEYVHCGRWERS